MSQTQIFHDSFTKIFLESVHTFGKVLELLDAILVVFGLAGGE